MKNSISKFQVHILVVSLLLSFIPYGCSQKASEDKAEIVVDLKNSMPDLEGKMLYLGNYNTRDFIDSCVVKEGKFKFSKKADENFSPIPVNIVYRTSNPENPYQLIGFKNPLMKKTGEINFFLDRGIMFAEIDSYKKSKNEILLVFKNLNRQTLVACRHLEFKSNLSKNNKIADYNLSLVKKYPYSIDLLTSLMWSKGTIPNNELRQRISFFDPSLQMNPLFNRLESYVRYDNQTGTSFPADIVLQKLDSSFTSEVLDKKSKYNLVVFWASWCLPCRKEIPQIKSLYAENKDKLNIASISVDNRTDWWKKAVIKEEMPWKQLLVKKDSSFNKLDKKYNLQSIPLWILFDADGKLIGKEVGFAKGENSIEQKVSSLIAKY